jgi:hypothetical protein
LSQCHPAPALLQVVSQAVATARIKIHHPAPAPAQQWRSRQALAQQQW